MHPPDPKNDKGLRGQARVGTAEQSTRVFSSSATGDVKPNVLPFRRPRKCCSGCGAPIAVGSVCQTCAAWDARIRAGEAIAASAAARR